MYVSNVSNSVCRGGEGGVVVSCLYVMDGSVVGVSCMRLCVSGNLTV